MLDTNLGTFSNIFRLNGTSFLVRSFCHIRSALLSVLEVSIATVIGPTPPGTGVIWAAMEDAGVNATSPTRRWPDFLVVSKCG